MPEIRPAARPISQLQPLRDGDSRDLAAEHVQSIAALLPQVLKRYLPAEASVPVVTPSGQQAA